MEATSFTQTPRRVTTSSPDALQPDHILSSVEDALSATSFIDMHTHLFSPALGKVGLWGIDELITYHYLEAEFFRNSRMQPEQYWTLTKQQRADAIWRTLFVENAPISESTRGIVAVLKAFGMPTNNSDLAEARAFFASQKLET